MMFFCISLPVIVLAQGVKIQCDNNIEFLRQDLLSMLNKIPALPPISDVYRAAKDRYEDFKDLRSRGRFSECVAESERVLRVTRPYGSR